MTSGRTPLRGRPLPAQCTTRHLPGVAVASPSPRALARWLAILTTLGLLGGCASSASGDAGGIGGGGTADSVLGGFDVAVDVGGAGDSAAGGGDDQDTAGHDAGGVADADVGPSPDAVVDDVGHVDDTAGADDGFPPGEDTSGVDTESDASGGINSKSDNTFLVPPDVSLKSDLALSESAAAWVETDAAGDKHLIFWAIDRGQDPVALDIPNLHEPSQLQLSAHWLVYVDTRYGDEDLFAWHLEEAGEQVVAVLQGPQHQPALHETRLIWRDCRGCIPGDPDAAAEIYTTDLGFELDEADDEVRVTDDEVDDRHPAIDATLGLLAWVAGSDALSVLFGDGEFAATWEVEGSVLGMELADGNLAYRQSPLVINPDSMMVINPDSMMPSDVFIMDFISGEVVSLTNHSETELPLLQQGVQLATVPDETPVAYLESVAGQLPLQRLTVIDAEGGPDLGEVEVESASEPVLSKTWMGFLAPRSDNDGQDDVHLLPL